jgi:hypothetical protein
MAVASLGFQCRAVERRGRVWRGIFGFLTAPLSVETFSNVVALRFGATERGVFGLEDHTSAGASAKHGRTPTRNGFTVVLMADLGAAAAS